MSSFYSRNELEQIGFKELRGDHILISRNATIYGAGNMILGNHVRIDDFCILSGKITLGDYIHVSAGAYLFAGEAGIVLEDYVSVSSRTAVYAVSDDYSGEGMANPMIPDQYRNVYAAEVRIEKHALIGSGCTILPGVTIGEGTAVGCMSLVNRSLDAWGIYVGIPVRRIKERSKTIQHLEAEFKKSEDQ